MERGALWLHYPVMDSLTQYLQRFRFTWGPFDANNNAFGANLSMGRFYHQGGWDMPPAPAPPRALEGSALIDGPSNLVAILPPKPDQAGFAYYPHADGATLPTSGRLINDFDDHTAIRDNLCRSARGWSCDAWCAETPPCRESSGRGPAPGQMLCRPDSSGGPAR